MPSNQPTSSRYISPSRSLELWKYFAKLSLWPRQTRLDPYGWLSNFQASEIQLAERLLQGYLFYSSELLAKMFHASFQNLSQLGVQQKDNYLAACAEWSRFIKTTLIVRVSGEDPNDTDSGYIFSRLSRDQLGFPESQVRSPQQAITDLMANVDRRIVFVDDFVGSGDQFVSTWLRPYNLKNSRTSFAQLARHVRPKAQFFYIPLICTLDGAKAIRRECKEVVLSAAHLLSEEDCALSPKFHMWRDDMQTEGPEFVVAASRRAGIPDKNGAEGCLRGYQRLGLTISFDHGTPDATLPIFTWEENNWRPLLRKVAR